MFRHNKMSPAKTAKRKSKQYTISTDIKDLLEAVRHADQSSEEEIFHILPLLNIKIIHGHVKPEVCQQVVDVIVNYLSTVKPGIELEKMCSIVLEGVGSKNPQMVFQKLCDKEYDQSLPVRSLLVAVGDLSHSQGCVPFIGQTWHYLLLFLRMAQEEDDMLAMCHALYGFVTSAREHLCNEHGKVMAMFKHELSFLAQQTFQVILNRWSLKDQDKVMEQVLVVFGNVFHLMLPSTLRNKVNRLTRWLMTLMSTRVTPFYISQEKTEAKTNEVPPQDHTANSRARIWNCSVWKSRAPAFNFNCCEAAEGH